MGVRQGGEVGDLLYVPRPICTYSLSFPFQLRAIFERGLCLDNIGGVHVGLVILANAVNGPVMMYVIRTEIPSISLHPASASYVSSPLPLSTYLLMPWKRNNCSWILTSWSSRWLRMLVSMS